MKDRIRAIMESYQLTQQQFAQRLGLGAATISSIFTGRTNPTNNHVQAIHRAFPEISTNWVLFGEGEMMVSNSTFSGSETSSSVSLDSDVVELNLGDTALNFSPEIDSPTLFSEVSAPSSVSSVSSPAAPKTNSRAGLSSELLKAQLQASQVSERAPKKIKEIRVFFDDGTFEVFSPSNK